MLPRKAVRSHWIHKKKVKLYFFFHPLEVNFAFLSVDKGTDTMTSLGQL